MVIIYALINPINGQPYYVGKTKNSLKSRVCAHLSAKKHPTTFSLASQGSAPEIFELDTVERTQGYFYEAYWIYQLKSWGFTLENKSISNSPIDQYSDFIKKHELRKRNRKTKPLHRIGLPI